MKYVLIILLGLSLPAMALSSSPSKNPSEQQQTTVKSKKNSNTLLEKLQKKSRGKICDPEKELKMQTFF